MSKSILITGTNRGLGLEFVKQYAKEGANIFACCRNPNEANELQSLAKQHKNISIHKLDVTLKQDIESLKNEINQPIDLLINNAGFLQSDTLDNVTQDVLVQSFLINSVGPLMLIKAFRKQLASSKDKLVACVTSSMGSIAENASGGYYSYRASKTALNMFMKSASIDLANDGIKIILLHPGWVQTRMGGESATITPEVSVGGMRNVIADKQKHAELHVYRYNGEMIPW